jgi:hypothetical protein
MFMDVFFLLMVEPESKEFVLHLTSFIAHTAIVPLYLHLL